MSVILHVRRRDATSTAQGGAGAATQCGRRRLIPSREQVTCNEPTVTPIVSAICSRLMPRSTRFLICCSRGVNLIGRPFVAVSGCWIDPFVSIVPFPLAWPEKSTGSGARLRLRSPSNCLYALRLIRFAGAPPLSPNSHRDIASARDRGTTDTARDARATWMTSSPMRCLAGPNRRERAAGDFVFG